MGTNDDWSFTFIARGLARSGRLRYDGWGQMVLGLQACWAALLIRLFGFSFTLVRLSTGPFAAGCAVLVYRLGTYAGLRPSLSLFSTLTVTLSPLFIPLATSFMTDVPALFFWLAGIYCGLRAVRAIGAGEARRWIWAVGALGVAGGTLRQVVWVVPLLVIPCVVWIRGRKETVVLSSAVLCWCTASLVILLCFLWFRGQPYLEVEDYSVGLQALFSRQALQAVRLAPRVFIACLTFSLPICILHALVLTIRRRLPSRRALITGFLLVGASLAAIRVPEHLLLGNIVTTSGFLYSGQDTFGGKPVILTGSILRMIRVLLFASGGLTLASVLDSLQITASRYRTPATQSKATVNPDSFRGFLYLYVPSATVYALALLYHVLDSNELYDRHLIELIPLLAIALLRHFQQKLTSVVPPFAWASIAALAFYGVATMHDAFAADRAKVQAASAILATGAPRSHITAGFEYDGWTQLEQSAHINSRYIRNPPGAYRPQERLMKPLSKAFWFWPYTPDIEPGYFVVYARVTGLRDSQFPAVSFTTWLPPIHRLVYTQTAGD